MRERENREEREMHVISWRGAGRGDYGQEGSWPINNDLYNK
jgi:hypothetical protein